MFLSQLTKSRSTYRFRLVKAKASLQFQIPTEVSLKGVKGFGSQAETISFDVMQGRFASAIFVKSICSSIREDAKTWQ